MWEELGKSGACDRWIPCQLNHASVRVGKFVNRLVWGSGKSANSNYPNMGTLPGSFELICPGLTLKSK